MYIFVLVACVSTPGIRQLQLMLLKVSLILGVEVHVNVEFIKLLEPPAEQTEDSESVCVCVLMICLFVVVTFFKNVEPLGKDKGRCCSCCVAGEESGVLINPQYYHLHCLQTTFYKHEHNVVKGIKLKWDPSSGPGWRAEVRPSSHPVSDFDFDVVIGADGRKNTLDGEKRGGERQSQAGVFL